MKHIKNKFLICSVLAFGFTLHILTQEKRVPEPPAIAQENF